MDFELDELQKMVCATAARFVGEIDSFHARRTADTGYPARIRAAMAEMGWTGIAAAEEHGGFGGRAEDLVLLMQETGFSSAAPMLLGNVILPTLLLRASDMPAARSALSHLIDGTLRFGFAGYEAEQGYGLDRPRTMARRDGADWCLVGAKHLAFGGGRPDQLLVTVQIDHSGQTGLFLIDAADAGVAIREHVLIDGMFACDITFDGHVVDDAALVLQGQVADAAVSAAVDLAALCQCAAIVGCMDRATRLTADYLKVREQFRKPLAEFQVLQHRVSDMFIATNDARSMLYAALAATDGTPDLRARAISACKVKVMDAAGVVTGEAVHLHGGIGFTKEYEVGALYQRAVVMKRLLGDREYHLARVASLAAGN